MIVGLLSVEIIIPGSTSLKGKRAVINRMKDRLHHKYNVSVAEVDFQEKWQRATMAIALVADNRKYAEQVLNDIFRNLDQEQLFEIVHYQFEYL